MKIKFLAFSYTKPYSFNPIYYWLKSFYKKNGKHYDSYEWLPTEYFFTEDIVDRIIEEGTDILCLSVYLWNFESQMKVAKEVHEREPDIQIIVGGPECHANTEDDWFETNYWVDFAIYGDGENAFRKLMDWYIEPGNELEIPNLVHRDYKSKHEIFRFRLYDEYSPILDLKDEFLSDYKSFKKKVNDAFVYLPYERARGCMYSCAFCDWQSGLHYKVNSRINPYEPEIDFFAENNIKGMQTDANVGMLKEDQPMYEYVHATMKKHNISLLPVEPRNMAKLHKNKVAKIYDILCQSTPEYTVKVSLQSIYDDVLQNIDRPDVPWEEHRKIIMDIRNKYPNAKIIPELIMGLPGMTYERILETHLDFVGIPMRFLQSYEWILLKKSPAYNPAYRKKHGLSTTKTYYPAIFNTISQLSEAGEINVIDAADFNKDPNISIQKNQAYFIDMVYDTKLGVQGSIYHKMLTRAYNDYAEQNKIEKLPEFLHENNKYIIEVSEKEAELQNKHYDKYGFFVWGTIDDNYIRNYDVTIARHIADGRHF